MKQYETIFVIDSLLKNNEIDEIIKRYERFISANGGNIRDIQRWGKRRLAYEIKKRQYGFYVYVRFEGPGTVIKPLEREFTLNESILRYLNIALDEQALKAEALRKQTPGLEEKSVAQEEALDEHIGEFKGDTEFLKADAEQEKADESKDEQETSMPPEAEKIEEAKSAPSAEASAEERVQYSEQTEETQKEIDQKKEEEQKEETKEK